MPISHGHKFLTFEDYIPELQADTLIQAAKIKQNLYDEGQSKIQEYYNALSNLPIVRDADKQYMDRELNKIFSVLQNNVGSADFSNPQTVRSYIDIAGPLEKDPILRNAMESTAEYRNRLNTLEKARSSGKYSPANEWQYMNDIEDWISNPNPGAKLQQKQYLPYQDLSKKVGDLASKLKPDVDVEIDNMVKSGQIRLDEVESVSRERLRNAIYASLDPYEQQQLQIDSSYTSAKTPAEKKYNDLLGYHNDMYNTYLWGSRNPQFDSNKQRAYGESAQATKELLNSFVNSDGTANMDNINDAYANYYRDKWDEGMLNAYAYEQRKSKLYNNPISLESIKLSNSMSLANQRFKNQMATKGLVPNGQGGFQKAPWYDLVQSQTRMANTKYKPAGSPKIFADKDVNDSVMDQFKQNKFTQATYSGTELEQNFDSNFINRILGKAVNNNWTTIDPEKNVPVNNVETFTIVKNPDNTVSYKMQFKDIDGVKTINDTELNKAYQDFFTGQNVYDYNSLESAMNNYNPAVSTVNQSQFTNTKDALGFLQSNGYVDEDFQQILQDDELPVGYMLTPPTE